MLRVWNLHHFLLDTNGYRVVGIRSDIYLGCGDSILKASPVAAIVSTSATAEPYYVSSHTRIKIEY